MRIIAGEWRSRKLITPDGQDTRPTADRVKEALFSILGGRLWGARVLDLYGGSGALALEALSRGAVSAVICDQAGKACRAIRENIGTLGCADRARLLPMKDSAAIEALERENAAFDLILLDPPYRMDATDTLIRLEKGLLAPGGMIVAEHAKETPPRAASPLQCVDTRVYGITGVSFFTRREEETP